MTEVDMNYFYALEHLVDEDIEVINSIYKYDALKDGQKLSIAAPRIADKLALTHGFAWLGDERGEFIKYEDGVWKRSVFQRVSELAQAYLEKYQLTNHENNVRECRLKLKSRHPMSPAAFEADERFVNFKNGLLDLETWNLEPHRKTHLTFIQIGYDYNPAARAPKFEKWLIEACGGDCRKIHHCLAAIGYCMQHSVGYQKAFILSSREPMTGKSSFINILAAVVGDENCAKIRLDEIADRQHAKASMAHKLVNYFTDLPTYIEVKNTGVIKDIISDREFVYEAKYMPHMKHKNIIKCIFSCNGLPWVKNIDEAFARRFLIIRFTNTIDHPVPHWEFNNIINNPEEMEGIINYATRAFMHVKRVGGFRSASGAEVLEQWRMETDIIFKFVRTCCRTDRNLFEPQPELYEKFVEFQDMSSDTRDIQQNSFTRSLKSMGITVKQKWDKDENGKQVNKHKVYQGISFRSFP